MCGEKGLVNLEKSYRNLPGINWGVGVEDVHEYGLVMGVPYVRWTGVEIQ